MDFKVCHAHNTILFKWCLFKDIVATIMLLLFFTSTETCISESFGLVNVYIFNGAYSIFCTTKSLNVRFGFARVYCIRSQSMTASRMLPVLFGKTEILKACICLFNIVILCFLLK